MNGTNGEVLAIVAIIGAVASGVVAIIRALKEPIQELKTAQAAQTTAIQEGQSASAERGAQVQGKLDVIHHATNSSLEALRHELSVANERMVTQANDRIGRLEQTISELALRNTPAEMLTEQARITEKAVELLGQSTPPAPAPPAPEPPPDVKDEGEKGN